MFILYTVAPMLYRMASSAYYNLSILSSDFYGLLFGLFLFVRSLFLRPPPDADSACPALPAILALLPFLRGRHRRASDLFLERAAYVHSTFRSFIRI